MSETKKNSKKQKMKKGNMRKTILMAVLCVVLLSSATYAWFTLSDSAKITNLSLGVTEASGLLIAEENNSETGPGEYGSVLQLPELTDLVLRPATLGKYDSITKDTMLKDVRSTDQNIVDGYEAVGNNEFIKANTGATVDPSKTYYYLEKTFYLKSSGSNLGVVLKKAVFDNTTAKSGTYVTMNVAGVPTKLSTTDLNAAAALKIAFFDASGNVLAMYEPNADNNAGNNRTDKATVNPSAGALAAYSSNLIKQNVAGTFIDAASDNSDVLFNLTSGADCKVIMRVFVDGEDLECVNAISLSEILGNLEFTTAVTDGAKATVTQ